MSFIHRVYRKFQSILVRMDILIMPNVVFIINRNVLYLSRDYVVFMYIQNFTVTHTRTRASTHQDL